MKRWVYFYLLQLEYTLDCTYYFGCFVHLALIPDLFYLFQGDKIQASLRKQFERQLESMIAEGCVRIINNFIVSDNDSPYKIVNHPHKLILNRSTMIQDCHGDDIPFNNFAFAQFVDIRSQTYEANSTVGKIIYLRSTISFFYNHY